MCRFFSFGTWLAASVVWTGIMAYLGYVSAPVVPLDISAADPATTEALHAALLRHSLLYGALAAVPPLVTLLVGRRLCKR